MLSMLLTTAQRDLSAAERHYHIAEADHLRYADDESAHTLADAQTIWALTQERYEQLEAEHDRQYMHMR